mmetsp:Transcript_51162/g.121595  ORF Transcript_51162/g.121595 Transcript_51162/m.121595 type:complete len:386 (-) Transcript_51162:186-1343(-)|eukprot:CAMPEP_0178407844 /NCGR_PEP_ID=MMETSP0689_2-20121128/19635_1 /TAXON_ID=160604 /ORGANISM="Amphidinium massartii, Strain CS-259" /LENGTH=385 /DNA_ID=CAMNT_0020028925 /DNA_START=89 /DNA_END=1246 /DNA_ORIENTATION=+
MAQVDSHLSAGTTIGVASHAFPTLSRPRSTPARKSRQCERADEASPKQRTRSIPRQLKLPVGVPSQGSIFHEIGACRPCAWFWKKSGCQNGAECRHCHACPKGELKARKKAARAAAARKEEDEAAEAETEAEMRLTKSEQCRLASKDSVATTMVPSEELAPCWDEVSTTCSQAGSDRGHSPNRDINIQVGDSSPRSFVKEAELLPMQRKLSEALYKAAVTTPVHHTVRIKNTFIDDFVDDLDNDEGADAPRSLESTSMAPVRRRDRRCRTEPALSISASDEGEDDVAADNMTRCTTLTPTFAAPVLGSAALPSEGSALHYTGDCRPCAWVWKASGCKNGSACRHCHLCPPGEVKARKKSKLAIKALHKEAELQQLREEEQSELMA